MALIYFDWQSTRCTLNVIKTTLLGKQCLIALFVHMQANNVAHTIAALA